MADPAQQIDPPYLLAVETPPNRTAVDELLGVVAREYGVTADDIRGRCRSKSIAEARGTAAALLRDLAHMSFPEIGRALNRDHTTIISGVRSTAKRVAKNAYAARTFAKVREAAVAARDGRACG